MRRNKITIEKYLKALKYSDFNLVHHLTTELVDPRRQQDTLSSVFLTWKLSFDQISKEEPRTAEILLLMAFLDGQGIPEILIKQKEYLDVKDTNVNYNMEDKFTIHRDRDQTAVSRAAP